MNFLGVQLHSSSYFDFFHLLKNPVKKTLVFTPNPEIFVRAYSDSAFLEILKQADYNTPDGNGLYVGSMMQEGLGFFHAGLKVFFLKKQVAQKYGELIKGSDLTRDIFSYAEQTNKKIMMIDNYRIEAPKNSFEVKKMNIQNSLQTLLKNQFPNLSVHLLFFGEKSPQEIAELIQKEGISYVFSCIGMKTQEQHLVEIFSHLPEQQATIGIGVGASVDFLLGLQTRAPNAIRVLGLEWLYRLMMEPRKRSHRIWDAVVEFPRIAVTPIKEPR